MRDVIDSNSDGVISADEGVIVITGGTNVATGELFTGRLQGVVGEHSVITPLTTLVTELAKAGESVEDAETLVRTALGLPATVDIGTYDHVEEAASGGADAEEVLSAVNRVAQAATLGGGFAGAVTGGTQDSGDTYAVFMGELAKSLKTSAEAGESSSLEDAAYLETVVGNAVTALDASAQVDTAQLSGVSEMIARTNTLVEELVSDAVSTADLAMEITRVKSVSENNLVEDVTKLVAGEITPSAFLDKNSTETLKVAAESVTLGNLFPPSIDEHRFFVTGSGSAAGTLLGTVSATDADGDTDLSLSLPGGDSLDLDGDGTGAFEIEAATGRVLVADTDDFSSLQASTTLALRVTDSGGVSSDASLAIDFLTGAFSGSEAMEEGSSWRQSTWLGYMYFHSDEWIYHLDLGWLYLPSLNADSPWMWSQDLGWIWTNSSTYPYFYQTDGSSSSWIYYIRNDSGENWYYNYSTSSWNQG